MALVLNEEQSMLRDSARGFIGDKAPVAHLRKLRDSKDATGFSRELWKALADMGFAGLLVPEEFGGSALGCVEAGVVMEEIGRTLMPSPFLSTAVLAASAGSQTIQPPAAAASAARIPPKGPEAAASAVPPRATGHRPPGSRDRRRAPETRSASIKNWAGRGDTSGIWAPAPRVHRCCQP